MSDIRFDDLEEIQRDPRFVRYRAVDTRLECRVMLEQPGPATLQRLSESPGLDTLREAKALAKLDHPNIVRLRELLEVDGTQTMVLDLPDGERLDQLLLRETSLEPRRVRWIGVQLAVAAGAIHQNNIVHRGIGAGNVFIDMAQERVRLAGFTFAKPVGGVLDIDTVQHRIQHSGFAVEHGLPDYVAPEQMRGRGADHRADVFALGCLLYRCATGSEAVAGPGVLQSPLPKPHQIDPAIPKHLSAAIMACLNPVPEQRPSRMLDVAQALESAEKPARASSGLRGVLVGAGIALAATLSVLGATGVFSSPDLEPRGQGSWVEAVVRDNLAPHYVTSRALLVGTDYETSDPDIARLKNAEADVDAIYRRLTDGLGWRPEHITRLLGPEATFERIRTALDDLRNAADTDDQVLIYFAGHGEPRNGGLRLLPHDASPKVVWLDADELTDFASTTGTRAKHVLVALDCCYSEAALVTRSHGIGKDSDAPLGSYSQRESMQSLAHWVLTSSAHTALDGKEHSPFAEGFLEALDAAIAGEPVSLIGLFKAIEDRITAVGAAQRAWLKAPERAGGWFYFIPKRS